MPATRKKKKMVNLALQGGGAHGAFTWGVLHELLEDGRLEFDGICATSAGTMNACALAYGLHQGGNKKAQEVLRNFWHAIAQSGDPKSIWPFEDLNPFSKHIRKLFQQSNELSFMAMDSLSNFFSPYQLNPFDFNPLKDTLEKHIDFEALRNCNKVKLFISATQVDTGKVKIFETQDISIDVALASACLPYLFKAVTIDGHDYWDGGYTGNPALYPLFYKTKTRDVMIVHINPMRRPETPKEADDIVNRINEISFNDSLFKELRAIAFVKKLLENDMLKNEYKDQFTNILVHSLRSDKKMRSLSVASKFNASWDFMQELFEEGRTTARQWLKANYSAIGKKDTIDVQNEFLDQNARLFDEDDK